MDEIEWTLPKNLKTQLFLRLRYKSDSLFTSVVVNVYRQHIFPLHRICLPSGFTFMM